MGLLRKQISLLKDNWERRMEYIDELEKERLKVLRKIKKILNKKVNIKKLECGDFDDLFEYVEYLHELKDQIDEVRKDAINIDRELTPLLKIYKSLKNGEEL